MFILAEAVLAVMILILAAAMFQEKNRKHIPKVAVIVQDSEDNQWASFKYGLKMAAEDSGIEMTVVNTEGELTVREEQALIENEIENGADAVIAQPVPGEDTEEMLDRIAARVPVVLVGYTASEKSGGYRFSVAGPDNFEMGKELAEEILRDFDGSLQGKTIGVLSETQSLEAVSGRNAGLREAAEQMGATIKWSIPSVPGEKGQKMLLMQPETDIIVALDDASLRQAGQFGKGNGTGGARLYGIGHSTESVYYLDTGIAECILIPDQFSAGYQSLTEIGEALKHFSHETEDKIVSYSAVRRDTLFSKENQEILFTMSQ